MDRAQTLKEKEEVTLSFMLTLAFWILAATVAFGSALAFLHLRAAKLPPWPVGALHGLGGATGLVVLTLALQGPARGAEYGVSAFGPAAAVLVALALVMGLAVLIWARRFRRTSGLVIAIHSTIAVTAFVLLLAYVSFS
jgi:hypothetical protein